jgi:uncharacterized protein
MTLSEQITSDMKDAMKAKANATLSTLRLLRSAIKNKEIDLQHALTDDEVLAVVKYQVKQLKDSIVSYDAAGRDQMVKDAQVEVDLLSNYLPAEMGDEELEKIVRTVIEQTGATSKADMGKVMGAAMKAADGGADGNRVKEIVMKLLPMLLVAVMGTFTNATNVLAAIPLAGDGSTSLFSADVMVIGLQAFRVIILWFGIGAIVTILNGGFQYMTSSMRDDSHVEALSKVTTGVFVSMIVAATFAATTVVLQQIG